MSENLVKRIQSLTKIDSQLSKVLSKMNLNVQEIKTYVNDPCYVVAIPRLWLNFEDYCKFRNAVMASLPTFEVAIYHTEFSTTIESSEELQAPGYRVVFGYIGGTSISAQHKDAATNTNKGLEQKEKEISPVPKKPKVVLVTEQDVRCGHQEARAVIMFQAAVERFHEFSKLIEEANRITNADITSYIKNQRQAIFAQWLAICVDISVKDANAGTGEFLQAFLHTYREAKARDEELDKLVVETERIAGPDAATRVYRLRESIIEKWVAVGIDIRAE